MTCWKVLLSHIAGFAAINATLVGEVFGAVKSYGIPQITHMKSWCLYSSIALLGGKSGGNIEVTVMFWPVMS